MAALIIKLLQLFIGIIAIGIIVLIHEAGHFMASRLLKVDVEIFSVGMGPCLFSFQGRKTEYRISLIPFGGYCRMKGSIDLTKALKDEAKHFDVAEHGSYFSTTPFVRFLIFLAGPMTNLLLSCILFIIIALIPVETISNEPRIVLTADYEDIYHTKALQGELRTGDLILTAGGAPVSSYEELESYILEHRGSTIPVTLMRDGEELSRDIVPTITETGAQYGITLYQKPVIGRTVGESEFYTGDLITEADGHLIENTNDFYRYAHQNSEITLIRSGESISFTYTGGETFPFAWDNNIELRSQGNVATAISDGFKRTASTITSTLDSLIKVVTGRSEDARQEITGPTRAAQSIGNITMLGFETSWRSGLRALLYLSSIVSLSLFIANMLPIPSFDGGGMLISLVQIIIGHELSPRAYVYFQIAGLIASGIILILMYSLDLKHYFF